MINKARLWIATSLVYVAARIAPHPMAAVFVAYVMMLEKFPAELQQGRTYGVIAVPWALSSTDQGKAFMMQNSATQAAAEARQNIERTIK